MNVSTTAKIAVLIDSIKEGGGAEKNAVRLAEGLHQTGYDSLLTTFYTFQDEYEYAGARVSFAEEPAYTLLKKSTKFYHRLRAVHTLLQDSHITHVVAFLEAANLTLLCAKLLFRGDYKVIVSVRADPRRVNWLRRQVIRFGYRQADTVVAVSRDMQRILETDFGLTNVLAIPNPIDVEHVQKEMQKPLHPDYQFLAKLPKDAKVFVNVGRLTDQKAQDLLIRAFAHVHAQYANTYLVIVGEGPKREDLEQLIYCLGLDDRIFLTGQQSNIYPFLQVSDCFVLTSKYEGFPNVLLEAAAAGLYIISTDCPTGPREIIAPDTLGYGVKYPYRVSGASLVEILNTNNQKQSTNISNEMAKILKSTSVNKEIIKVTQYSLKANFNSWHKVIQSYDE